MITWYNVHHSWYAILYDDRSLPFFNDQHMSIIINIMTRHCYKLLTNWINLKIAPLTVTCSYTTRVCCHASTSKQPAIMRSVNRTSCLFTSHGCYNHLILIRTMRADLTSHFIQNCMRADLTFDFNQNCMRADLTFDFNQNYMREDLTFDFDQNCMRVEFIRLIHVYYCTIFTFRNKKYNSQNTSEGFYFRTHSLSIFAASVI